MRDAAEGRDPRWYGEDAARTREKAKLTDDPVTGSAYQAEKAVRLPRTEPADATRR